MGKLYSLVLCLENKIENTAPAFSIFLAILFGNTALSTGQSIGHSPFSQYKHEGSEKPARDWKLTTKPEDYKLFGGDTLDGLDLKGKFEYAKANNFNDEEVHAYLRRVQRMYVFAKYAKNYSNQTLKHDPFHNISRFGDDDEKNPRSPREVSNLKVNGIKTNSTKQALSTCNNMDFSDGNYTNWTCAIGSNGDSSYYIAHGTYPTNGYIIVNPSNKYVYNSAVLGNPPSAGTNANQDQCSWFTLQTSAGGNDPWSSGAGTFPVVPAGSTYSCRLGGYFANIAPYDTWYDDYYGGYGFPICGSDNATYAKNNGLPYYSNTTNAMDISASSYADGCSALGEFMDQSFVVSASNCVITINYAVVLNDGGHKAGQQAFCYFNVVDASGNTVSPCLQYYQEAVSGVPPTGYKTSPWTSDMDNSTVYYLPWKQAALDLTAYIGQTLTLEAGACGCYPGGHFAYMYFNASCGPEALPVTSPACGSGTVSAPPGAASYSWTGPCISGSTTGSSITATCSGTYSVDINLTGKVGCGYTVSAPISIPGPPTAVSPSSNSPICSGGSLNLTGSATNATSYSWSGPPGAGFASTASTTISGAPVSDAGTYTLTATNGCGSTSNTTVVTINATPTLSASASSPSICAGGSTTLTGGGASTYTWQPGALSGSTVSVSPGSSTTYTLTGSSAAGCPAASSATVAVAVSSPPVVGVSASPSTTICSGNSTTLTATNATTYTWQPGGLTGSTISVSPGSNTTYTVTGTAAGCSASAPQTIAITVNTTPTVTITSPPPTICSGNSTTLTASGASTYTWQPGGLTGSTVSVSPGSNTTYTLSGSSAAGCPAAATQTVAVTVNTTPTLSASASSPSICAGGSTTLTGSGASTYTWQPGGLTGSTVSVSPGASTTYTLTGSSAAGCSAASSATVAVSVSSPPVVGVSASSATICSGNSTTLTATNATTYTWQPGGLTGSTVSVSPASTTTYTVTGTAAGCSASAPQTIVITVNTTPTLSITSPPPTICSGNSTTLTASGASTYTWQPGALSGSTVSVSPGSTTTYTLSGSSAAGCPAAATQTIAVTVNPTPTLSASAGSPSICAGGSTTLTGSGASTYTWQPGALSGSTVSVSPGSSTTYTLTGSSAAGCPAASSATVAVSVSSPPVVGVSALPSTTICSGNTTTLTGSNATTYTWTPSGTLSASTGSSVVASPTTTTTYTVTGTAAGCSASAPQTIVITVNTTPTITASAGPATICSGNSTTLTGTGASTYTWQPGGLSGSTVSVSPGSSTTYTLSGTSAAGCPAAATQTVLVTVNTTPTVTISSAPPTICSGTSTTITATGASTYSWSPAIGATTSTVSVSPGTTTTYTVTGKSAAGCSNVTPATIVVTVNPTPTISVAPISPTICPGGNVNMTASSSTGGTTYTWAPSASLNVSTGATVNATPAATTTYTITGTALGCPATPITNVVSVAASLPVTVTPGTPTICNGDSIVLNASGAATFTWSPSTGLTCTTCPNPKAGPSDTTTYKVIGASGACKDSVNVTLNVNPTPTVSINITGISAAICPGDSMGMVASGATTYVWSPTTGLSCTTCATTNAGPGSTTTYTVTGSYATGCSSTASQPIVVYPVPTMSLNLTAATLCSGDSVTLTASGVTTYSWAPPAGLNTTIGSTVVATPTATTEYVVTGKGTGGCKVKDSALITVNITPTVTVVPPTPAICAGDSVAIKASGAPSYVWSPASGLNCATCDSAKASPASTVTYTVTGTSLAGCKNSATTIVTVNPLPVLSVTTATPSVCKGDSAAINVTGATSYSWSPAVGLNNTSGASVNAGPDSTVTYTVTGTDGNSCSSSSPITISVGAIVVAGTASQPAICAGNSTTINASGATSYTWYPATGLSTTTGSSVTANPATTTTYTLIGQAGKYCTDTTPVIVIVNPLPVVGATSSAATICSNGSVDTLHATGATTYVWSPATGLNSSTGTPVLANPGSSETYTVTGTDGNNCVNTNTVSVAVVTPPSISVSATGGDSLCNGLSKILNASGASSYIWRTSPAQTGSSITVSPTTNTTYTVVGSNGTCSDSSEITIKLYPNFNVTVTNDTACALLPASITATATGGSTPYSYLWSNGLGTNSSATVTISPGVTTYTCNVTDGCGQTYPATVVVDGVPTTSSVFTTSSDTIMGGQFESFIDSHSGATSWFWSLGDGYQANLDSAVYYQYNIPGTYIVTLWANNRFGCMTSYSDTIYVIQGIFIPNVFTPNGDGQNDVFHVTVGGMQTYHIEIFNRWGQKVFMTDSPSTDWDGTSTSGVQESDGNYYYEISATDYKNKPYTFHGYLQLIRD